MANDKQGGVTPKDDDKTVTKAVSSKNDTNTKGASQSQDFSKFAQGPKTGSHGRGTDKKVSKTGGQTVSTPEKESRGQFGQAAASDVIKDRGQVGQAAGSDVIKDRGQMGQAGTPDAGAGRGQFGQGTTPAGRGQFGQGEFKKLGRGQFKQAAPSEKHSQSLDQRREETIRRAHQQKFSAERASMRFRIIAASVAGVLVIGLILGIALIIGRNVDNRVVLSIDINMDNAQKSYLVGEALNVDGMKLTVNYTDGSKDVLDVKPDWITAGTQLDASRCFAVASPSGRQTSLVVTYKGIPKSFDVFVGRASVLGPTSISEVTAVRLTKNEYDAGESLAVNDAEIDYKMRNGTTGTMTIKQDEASRTNMDRFGPGLNWSWGPQDFSNVSGDRTVTVTHKDGAAFSFNVFVRGYDLTVAKITVAKRPLFLNYEVGESLQTVGMDVKAVMKDGTTQRSLNRNQYTVSPTVLHDVGEEVPVSVTYVAASGMRHVDTFTVSVTTDIKPNWNPATGSEFPVGDSRRGLEIKTAPAKRVYSVWEPLEVMNDVIPGFTLTARHEASEGKPEWEETIYVTRAMIVSSDLDHAGRFTSIGTKLLTIRYKGRTVTQSFIVTDGVRSLATLGATKTVYQLGDYLGRTDIEIVYNGIDKLTGLNRKERISLSGLEDADEKGFGVYCTLGGYNVMEDNFTQTGWTLLVFAYGSEWMELSVFVVEPYDLTKIVAGSVTELSLNDVLDLSKIRIEAHRVGELDDYVDRTLTDVVNADKLRGVIIESVVGPSGTDASTPTDEICYGVFGKEDKLTFDADKGPNDDGMGLRYIKVTYKTWTSIFAINIV